MSKSTSQQIQQTEAHLKQLRAQLVKENEVKGDWISISKTHEISAKPLHFNKTWQEQLDSLNEGEEVASYELLQKLRNSGKYPNSFTEFLVRVPNPDKISEANRYVAKFVADSDWAGLCCCRDPSGSSAGLGVFVLRKKSKVKK